MILGYIANVLLLSMIVPKAGPQAKQARDLHRGRCYIGTFVANDNAAPLDHRNSGMAVVGHGQLEHGEESYHN